MNLKVCILIVSLVATSAVLGIYDSCMMEPYGYFGNSFDCSKWPNFICGLLAVLFLFFIGPKKLWFYIVISLIVFIVSLFETLQIGFSFKYYFLSPFLHGSLIAGILLFVKMKYKSKSA